MTFASCLLVTLAVLLVRPLLARRRTRAYRRRYLSDRDILAHAHVVAWTRTPEHDVGTWPEPADARRGWR